jgi:hypothetical protein
MTPRPYSKDGSGFWPLRADSVRRKSGSVRNQFNSFYMLLPNGFSVAIKNTCIIVIIMIAGLVSVPQVVHASPLSQPHEGPSLDGVGTWIPCLHCNARSLTTTKEEDVIITVIWCYCQSDTPSIIDSAGLNYALRMSYTISQSTVLAGATTLWEYYATAESPLNSDNITVLSTGGFKPIQVFAIHPGDTKPIFDPNPLLPISITCPGISPVHPYQECTASAGRLANDLVMAITAIDDADRCPPSSGFSEVVFDGKLEIDYRVVRGTESDLAFTCTAGIFPNPRYHDSVPVAIVLDAISLHHGNSESSG